MLLNPNSQCLSEQMLPLAEEFDGHAIIIAPLPFYISRSLGAEWSRRLAPSFSGTHLLLLVLTGVHQEAIQSHSSLGKVLEGTRVLWEQKGGFKQINHHSHASSMGYCQDKSNACLGQSLFGFQG